MDRAQTLAKILDTPDLRKAVVGLCVQGSQHGSNTALKRHPWDLLLGLKLATVQNLGDLGLHRSRLEPTDLAMEIYRTHLVEDELKREDKERRGNDTEL